MARQVVSARRLAGHGIPAHHRSDADLRGKLTNIGTSRCPLYLLTGEYDFSCSPEDTLRTALSIPGAKVGIMREVGHFPMSENPEQFRRYILPVLDEIHTATTTADSRQ